MNFKNFSIILALFSFELKVFSQPVNDVAPQKELSSVEILDSEISTGELSNLEISDSEILNILDDNDSDSGSDSEDTSDLPCSDIKECVDWMKENSGAFEVYNITNEVIDYLYLQYQDEEKVNKLKQDFKAIDYGMMVDVGDHKMSVNIKGEENDKTIVLLPASGVPSPILFYNNFTDYLANDFKVVTIEPFGYGVSDLTEEKRTAENIVSEIHECLQELEIDQFYFMGHSIGGMFSLAYDNTYEDEVLGFIGLDNTPNNHVFNSTAYSGDFTTFAKVFDYYHLWGLLPENQKKQFLEIGEAEQQFLNFSEEEKKDWLSITSYRNGNVNMIDEQNCFMDTLAYTDGMYFHCPMLMFTSEETQKVEKEWNTLHENMIKNNPEKELIDKSNVMPLEGTYHVFIHNQKKDVILDEIKKWIN